MQSLKFTRTSLYSMLALSIALLFVASMFIYLAYQMEIDTTPGTESTLAFDWKIIWESIRNGRVMYGDGLYNPPWSLPFILPLGFLPLRVGYGLLMCIMLLVLIISVPRHHRQGRYLTAIALLVTSFSVLRNFADGNLEPFMIAGVLLLIYAYQQQRAYLLAASILLTTIKPQAVSLLMLVLAMYLLQTWSWKAILKSAVPVLLVIAITMLWRGEDWLEGVRTGRLSSGISLPRILAIYDVPVVVIRLIQVTIAGISLGLAYFGDRRLSRYKTGMLIAASILIAPYSNGHSMTAILAIGMIPLFVQNSRVGLPFVLLFHLPYIFLVSKALYNHQQDYWLIVALICWLVLAWQVYQRELVQNEPRETAHAPVKSSVEQ